MNYQTKC